MCSIVNLDENMGQSRILQVIVKNLSSGTRVVLKSHYGYEVMLSFDIMNIST